VSLRADVDAVVRRKIPGPYRDSNPLIMQPVAQRYTTKILAVVCFTYNILLESLRKPM
jgi:hypothetical protein